MTIRVERAGLLATVQDLGRPGLQHLAMVPGGAMDAVSHRIANALVGNEAGAATIEIALAGPSLAFETDALIAFAGAAFDATLERAPLPAARPVLVRAGSRLRIGRALHGAFGYLAVAGGVAVAPVLGSRATYLPGGFGGLGGAGLRRGLAVPLAADVGERSHARFDRLRRTGRVRTHAGGTAESVRWLVRQPSLPLTDPVRVRVIDGAHCARFDDASRAAFAGQRWRVAAESNRMGYRLAGPKLALTDAGDIASQAVVFGTVQVPPGGQPIVLLADRQTTGGYPRIAEVIHADLGTLVQAAPGTASLRFQRVTLDEADAARAVLAREVGDIIERLRWEYER